MKDRTGKIDPRGGGGDQLQDLCMLKFLQIKQFLLKIFIFFCNEKQAIFNAN